MELADLVRLAQRGDRTATAELYARFHRAVHAVVLARTSYADAADLVQDVFVTALRKLTELREPAAFPGWLMAIARNAASDHGRKSKRSNQHDELTPASATVSENSTPSADATRVLAALQTLPEAYRETLMMRLIEDMTGPEIAERTGLAPGSVRVNLHRGMEMLRAALAPDFKAEAV